MPACKAERPSWTHEFSESTVARLERYMSLLEKWNGAINLVAPASLEDCWSRHMLDSVQVFGMRGNWCRHWVDLGSGAGFPGMVVALLAFDLAPTLRVSLVESDQRKAEFLRTVSRETNVPVTIIASRIESLPPLQADIVSARALAPMPVLCGYAERHMAQSGRAIFLKGARAEDEVRAARLTWRFDLQNIPSLTDPTASVLVMTDLHRV